VSAPAGLAIATRPASPADVPDMVELMAPFVASGDLLPRTAQDLERDIDRYLVALDGGTVIGTGALKPYSPQLAEVIAIAVSPLHQSQGVGRLMVETLIRRAAHLGFSEVFALTRQPRFFHRLGFLPAEKSRFPLKVWFDCSRCPRRMNCDEIAVHLPDVAAWSAPA